MKKIVSRGAFLLLTLCLSLSTVGCKKSNESNKIREGQSISSNEKDKNETFKPSDYTLKTKKEYVYEYLGLKFNLSNKLYRNFLLLSSGAISCTMVQFKNALFNFSFASSGNFS